jgi:hypothetical protein
MKNVLYTLSAFFSQTGYLTMRIFQVKEILLREVEKRVPGISTLVRGH